MRNRFYKTGLCACLWGILLIAKWYRGLSLHHLAVWLHESYRAETSPLPSEVTATVDSWHTLFFLLTLMLVSTSLHFFQPCKTGVNTITGTALNQYDNKLIVVSGLLFILSFKILAKIFMSTVFASSVPPIPPTQPPSQIHDLWFFNYYCFPSLLSTQPAKSI